MAEKKSCLRRSHLALFFPPHRPIKPFIPGFFPQPSEKSQISTTQPSLVLFSSTSFLTFHKKTDPKKIENHKKIPIPTYQSSKTQKSTKTPGSDQTHLLGRRSSTVLPLEILIQFARKKHRGFIQSRSLSTVAFPSARYSCSVSLHNLCV